MQLLANWVQMFAAGPVRACCLIYQASITRAWHTAAFRNPTIKSKISISTLTHSTHLTYTSKLWQRPFCQTAIMADSAPAQAPEEQLANLHLDEVTGEKVSKSELKKRQKQRQKDAEKAKKAAATPRPAASAQKKTNAEAEEKELNPNVSQILYVLDIVIVDGGKLMAG